MVDRSEQSRVLEEVVRLLESARMDMDAMDRPSFEDGRVDSYVVTALTAARAAMNIAAQRENSPEALEPDW